MSDAPPPEVMRLVAQRSAHRARRDYPAADALREELRGLGWEVVDGPTGSTARAILPDGSTPAGSPLDGPAELDVSLQILADDDEHGLRRFVSALERHPPAGLSFEMVLVANAPSFDPAQQEIDPHLPLTVISTGARLGWADARNMGLRRSWGDITVLCDVALEPLGDFIGPLVAAFDDPTVGLAGPWGMRSLDARHFSEADAGEVDALQAYCLAVRRRVLREAGLFDPRYRFYRNADLDFSFQARAAGWRAVQVDGLPLRRHQPRAYASLASDELERLSKRNFYRFLKRWGDRSDLLLAHAAPSER